MSLAGRLYRGETNFDLVGRRKLWLSISAVLMVICIVSIIVKGFVLGVEFQGGNTYQLPGSSKVSLSQFRAAVANAGADVQEAQQAGNGSQQQLIITTAELSGAKSDQVKAAVAKSIGVSESSISDSHVSSSWGSDVSTKALRGLIAFLILVSIYIAIRFEARMAVASMLALLHDLVLSAGIYSLVGFEVTPSTIVGLLTILGFSLYDTVVVFDKVAENTKGILGGSRQTYSEAANLAVNQTFMRSINTSLISLLPVAGLLFVGAGLLGVGTLKDLALVLFVGLATGAYSSLFLATPLLALFKERERPYAALRQRVATRRSSATGKVGAPLATATGRRGARPAAAGTATALLERDEDGTPPAGGGQSDRASRRRARAAQARAAERPDQEATDAEVAEVAEQDGADTDGGNVRETRRRRRAARAGDAPADATADATTGGAAGGTDATAGVAATDGTEAAGTTRDAEDIAGKPDEISDERPYDEHDGADDEDDEDVATAGVAARADGSPRRAAASGSRPGVRPTPNKRKGGRPAGKKKRR